MHFIKAAILYLLLILVTDMGMTVPDYWLNLAQGQECLRQHGARETLIADWRIVNGRLEAVYWHKRFGMVIISWPAGEK